jgi:pimeloyl-ACP methyl ester carboxylesterase
LARDVATLIDTPLDPRALVQQSRATRSYDCRDRVQGLDVPTLVLHGDADETVDVELGRELAGLIPGAEYVELAGAGHNFFTVAFDEAMVAIERFLARQVAA